MIILHVAMSVDGFIAGPERDMSWTGGSEYSTASDLAAKVAGATGAVLAGRGWYDLASTDDGGAVAASAGSALPPELPADDEPSEVAGAGVSAPGGDG